MSITEAQRAANFGLVTVDQALVVRDDLSSKRRRNTYTLHMEALKKTPEEQHIEPMTIEMREDVLRRS